MSTKVTILVVDDEAPLLRLMQAFLERLGYQVEGFADAASALKRFESDPDHFQVVVTDLTLPDMPGDQLAMAMLRLNSSLRVLLCSGYAFETGSLPAEIRPRVAMLQKPFLPNMLTKAVEDLLSRK